MGAKRDIAKTWLAAMKSGTRMGQNEKLLKIYTDFLFSWLGLIFLGKDILGDAKEKKILCELISRTPNALIEKIYAQNHAMILELGKLKVENEDPRDKSHDEFEEADFLTLELVGTDKRATLNAALRVLYVVRCNLFHANKSPSETRDNNIMFYASKITASISWTLVQELP